MLDDIEDIAIKYRGSMYPDILNLAGINIASEKYKKYVKFVPSDFIQITIDDWNKAAVKLDRRARHPIIVSFYIVCIFVSGHPEFYFKYDKRWYVIPLTPWELVFPRKVNYEWSMEETIEHLKNTIDSSIDFHKIVNTPLDESLINY